MLVINPKNKMDRWISPVKFFGVIYWSMAVLTIKGWIEDKIVIAKFAINVIMINSLNLER